jgi:ABC-2 type transport system permease protein
MNWLAVRAIYHFEMSRWFRTIGQSVASPVLSTSLYFIVFGAAIGSRMGEIGGVSYGAFIIPGLMMLSILNESIGNASFGIYFPKWSGTIFEILSAPVSWGEMLLGYVGAATTKSMLLGLLILITARVFVPYEIEHPFWMIGFLLLTAASFSLFGFLIGLWADSWEKLQTIPLLVITPLTFLGGAFYSLDMLPSPWREITYFNPVVYLISGFRWSFYGIADVHIAISTAAIFGFLITCILIARWMILSGWRLKR